MSTVGAAFRASVPVLFGYVPLGMAFGILFQDLGYAWYYAPLMGLTVYAGAAQFMAVGLLAAHASLFEVALSTFILNSRHMFFGVSLLSRYRAQGLKKLYLIFGLTDETYSLITSTHPPTGHDEQNYYLALTALNQSYWITGCALGALFGANVQFDTSGMDFTLTALFMVLMLEQWKKLREPYPFVVALLCGLAALWLFREQMLLVSISLSIALLLLRSRISQVVL
ncbi:AzlC family ABC transporter permease [Sedimenticola thiotaurini]|uniref:Branched-chain amino acid permease n=1 Tax=Sedimenticola thiotaurini TaxID=1543721 RepID=A0A0F7K277_9GAMM|nr:AzlC family ABC transporter permease [Sedimenticola thiotaurini]AKH21639.1 branched-chain amino acid permease [Sedimenticola thiotaurini]